MTEGEESKDRSADLRRRAEESLGGQAAAPAGGEAQHLLHELQVHQIELEMQNDELRQAQEQLEASRTRYFDLYDLAPVGYFTLNEHGLILEANLTAATLLGVPRSSLAKQPIARFLFRDDQDIFYLHHTRLFDTGTRQVCEVRVMRPGGELFWARLEATLASDGEQGPSVCRAVMSDVTERKRADEARDYLDNLLSHVNTPIIVWGSDFQITRFNGAFERLTGLKAGDVLGRKLDFIFPKDRRPEIMTRIRRSAAGKCWEEMEIPVRCLDGTVRTLLWNSAALVAADGTTVMVTIAQGQDITERMRAESQREAALKVLHERRDYLDSLLTYASAPIVVWDPDFRITRFNGAFEHLTGLQAGDMLGRELDILFPEARRDEAMAYTRRADAGERWEAVEIPIRHVDGTTRIVLWNSATLYAADGTTVIATIAQGQDITERVQAEEQIKAALAEKEVLMREIYHRVKNNLQALIYLMDMQADYIPDASARQMIRELQERARSMALVHEKLYQSHNLAQVDFGDYLHDLVDNLSRAFGTGRLIIWRVEAENALLSVETAIPCGLVVTELLTNALKYAFPDGQPRTGRDETECKINVEFRAEGERFTLVVADNGVGLPPDLDWTTTPSLGLQLINVLACHQLGGQVEVDTRAGTAFKITFAERNNR